jgi:hypothetical protein
MTEQSADVYLGRDEKFQLNELIGNSNLFQNEICNIYLAHSTFAYGRLKRVQSTRR